ncbi:MAG: transglutaminase domain-containing protein [Cloacibacterium sp.]|nr:transglutaminase domain-containing protein [Cloacibacterium sp.]
MKIKFLSLAFLTIFTWNFAQKSNKSLKVIKSNVENIDIRDNEKLSKNAWRISPDIKPDSYQTSSLGKKVTFITDVDSISFIVKKNEKQDFIIVKGKDSAWTRVEYKPSHLDILRKGKDYNEKDFRFFPKFSYQSSQDQDLQRLRKELKLDSVAGKGSDVSKMINLMHFVHNIVRHDGSSINPTLKNSIDLINICKKENRGLNCRMMAVILNECYLAMDFKSRYVTCMPRDLKFDDCHVINMVYSDQLKKWIWMDPTFDAFVMDEKGNLLGIEEVRERLIANKPLIINPNTNWNNEQTYTKEMYLDMYMAKNLYRLESPIESVYNRETPEEGKVIEYVELLPLDGLNQSPQKSEEIFKDTKTKHVRYITNNPKLFYER